jgi:hypothetical protein
VQQAEHISQAVALDDPERRELVAEERVAEVEDAGDDPDEDGAGR